MDWNPAYTWLVIALLLSLAELTSGAMLLHWELLRRSPRWSQHWDYHCRGSYLVWEFSRVS